jgi:hypothetical protein
VIAQNEVGYGYVSQARTVRQAWKVFPSITYPDSVFFPLQAAQWNGKSLIWFNGASSQSILLRIVDLPFIPERTQIEITFRMNAVTAIGKATVVSRSVTSFGSYLDDPLGLGVTTNLLLEPPAFESSATGLSVGKIFAPGYPLKSVNIALQFFLYPLTTLDFRTPDSGPAGGGNQIKIQVVEPRGLGTRYDASLTNFIDASMSASGIEVFFNNTQKGTVDEVAMSGINVVRMLITVPANSNEGVVPITFKIGGVPIQVQGVLNYVYRGAFVDAVIPANGLTKGNTAVTLVVRDLGTVAIKDTPEVTFGGIKATVTQYVQSSEQVLISATTPPGAQGTSIVVVTIDRVGFGKIELKGLPTTVLYTYVPSPQPVFQNTSLRIEGRVTGLWVDLYLSTKVTFTVNHMYGTSPTVAFNGNAAASATAVANGNPDDERFQSIDVTAFTPPNACRPNVAPCFWTITITIGARTVNSLIPIEFRDTAVPTIASVGPSESRLGGGSIVYLGLTGFCKGVTCPPTRFTSSFTIGSSTFEGEVQGFVSMASWVAQDASYRALVGGSAVSDFLAGIGPGTQSLLRSVINIVQSQIDTSGGRNTAADSFVVIVKTPNMTSTRLATATKGTVRVSFSTNQATSDFDIIPDFSTAAAVTSVSPSQSGMPGGVLISLTLTSFSLVYASSEITLLLGADRMPVENIDYSNSLSTRLSFINPSSAAGTRTITVFPTRAPWNMAVTSFLYRDLRTPELVSDPVPNQMYANGGTTVTVVMRFFGDSTITTSQVLVTIKSGTTSVAVDASSVTVSFDSLSSETTVTFRTPAAAAGAVEADVQYVPTLRSVSFQLLYISLPTGPATMVLTPSSGDSTGGYTVTCFLTNFQSVSDASQITVTVGGSSLPASSIQRVTSNTQSTFVQVLAPFSSVGGPVNFVVRATGRDSNAGTASFMYIDVNRVSLSYLQPAEGDSGSATTLSVGIANIGTVYTSPSQLQIAASGFASVLAPSIKSIRSSTVSLLALEIEIPKSPIVLTSRTSVTITVRPIGGSALKTLTFTFFFLPLGAPRISFFRPNTYYTDGGLPMTVEIENLPTAPGSLMVNFSSTVSVPVQYSSITFAVPSDAASTARFSFTIPPAAAAGSVTPVVIRNGEASFFPSSFTYTNPPAISFRSVFPSSGLTNLPSIVTVTLDNFPAVTAPSDIIVVFGDDARISAAQVLSEPVQLDPTLSRQSIQSLQINVKPPCCTADIVTGKIKTWAFHRSYPLRAAIADTSIWFEYYSPTLPRVTKVDGDNEGDYVKMTRTTTVKLSVSNLPAGLTLTSELAATVRGVAATIAVLVVSATGEDASVTVIVPASTSPGDAAGTLTFFPMTPSRSQSVSFTVTYYNDAQPSIVSMAPSEGPRTGGTILTITIANFPIVRQLSDVTATFDSVGANLGTIVSIVSSDMMQTVLQVMTPAYDVPSGFVQVPVTITPIAQNNKVPVPRVFQYNAVRARLRSFSPSRAPLEGGVPVSISIDFFPAGISAGAIGADFDGEEVSASNITVLDSTILSTQLRLIAPPAAAPGRVTMYVYAKSQGKESAPVVVEFEYFDIYKPVLVDPLPIKACRSTAGQTEKLYVSRMNPAATASNTFIKFDTNSEKAVSAVTISGRVTVVDVVVDNIQFTTPSSRSINVLLRSFNDTISFTYLLYDCNVPNIISFSPTKGVTTGGRSVTIVVSNFNYPQNTLTAVFGTASATVTSMTMAGSTATVLVTAPAIQLVGTVSVTLTATGTAPLRAVTANFQYVTPCSFSTFCLASGLIVNPTEIADDPPPDDTCSIKYCIDPNTVPFPSVDSFLPSTGTTQGGTLVTAQLRNFPTALLSAVTVTVISGDSQAFATPTSITDLGQYKQLTFTMPASPVGAREVLVVMNGLFSSIQRSASNVFRYFKPISGPAVVSMAVPNSISRNVAPTSLSIYIELTNFPELTDLTATNQIVVQVGTATTRATSIVSSTPDITIARIPLPAITLTANTDYTVLVYQSSISRAGSFTLRVNPDPVPLLTSRFPDSGLASVVTALKVYCAHMPVPMSRGSITATVRGARNATAPVTVTADPLLINDQECASFFCSKYLLDLSLPINPDGILNSGVATIRVRVDYFALR